MNIKKSGFITIVGKANVGKSTLLNKILGQKLAIVSSKPQTTRTKIMAIHNTDDCQMIFLDTPGFHNPKTKLGQSMVSAINKSIFGTDVIVMLIEPKNIISKTEIEIIEKIAKSGTPAILAINKVDTVAMESVLPIMETVSKLHNFDAIIPISAQKGKGVDALMKELEKMLPEGEALFDEDTFTDRTERQIVEEIVREKLLRLLSEEVPHGTAVEVLKMKEKKGGMLDISANIYCEKDGHKGIIIGKNGAMLKTIGTQAREDIEKFFGVKVYLQLWVKVKEDWRNSTFSLKELGFLKEDENNFE